MQVCTPDRGHILCKFPPTISRNVFSFMLSCAKTYYAIDTTKEQSKSISWSTQPQRLHQSSELYSHIGNIDESNSSSILPQNLHLFELHTITPINYCEILILSLLYQQKYAGIKENRGALNLETSATIHHLNNTCGGGYKEVELTTSVFILLLTNQKAKKKIKDREVFQGKRRYSILQKKPCFLHISALNHIHLMWHEIFSWPVVLVRGIQAQVAHLTSVKTGKSFYLQTQSKTQPQATLQETVHTSNHSPR